MIDERVTIEIEVSSEEVATEIGYGVLGRAGDIHNNPDDDFEWMAEELKEIAWDLIGEHSP